MCLNCIRFKETQQALCECGVWQRPDDGTNENAAAKTEQEDDRPCKAGLACLPRAVCFVVDDSSDKPSFRSAEVEMPVPIRYKKTIKAAGGLSMRAFPALLLASCLLRGRPFPVGTGRQHCIFSFTIKHKRTRHLGGFVLLCCRKFFRSERGKTPGLQKGKTGNEK